MTLFCVSDNYFECDEEYSMPLISNNCWSKLALASMKLIHMIVQRMLIIHSTEEIQQTCEGNEEKEKPIESFFDILFWMTMYLFTNKRRKNGTCCILELISSCGCGI